MKFLRRLFKAPTAEPPPEGVPVSPEEFGTYSFTVVHDLAFSGGQKSFVSEFRQFSLDAERLGVGRPLDIRDGRFRVEYVAFLLGAVNQAVALPLGEMVARRVRTAGAKSAVETFCNQLGKRGSGIRWPEVAVDIRSKAQKYATMGSELGSGEEFSSLGAYAARELTLAPADPFGAACLVQQYLKTFMITTTLMDRNPIQRPPER